MAKPLTVHSAAEYMGPNPPEMSQYAWRMLADGDSWFSIGALNLFKSANLLNAMENSQFSVAIQCAYPGDTLRRIVQTGHDPQLTQLLTGNISSRWDAILLSAGGNDLIDAAGSDPSSPPHLRLLRTKDEWGAASQGGHRYLSAEGWQTFSEYFRANLDEVIALRDRGPSKGRPICMHTYAYPTPRPSGAGAGQGPWLMPSLVKFGIPEADWPALARALLDQLAELMLECAADQQRYPGLDVFDSRSVPIVPAALGAGGESGDWLNEIHLSKAGCRKLSHAWCAHIEQVLVANP
jgi:hypothetical protein